ncbi:MAG TPA: presqualene diphosphate synthase HpnD [Acidimicrobiales bacterium]|nr:presqualene diphosphate synthase HpnD [Acidimicrobiales bacterium]
MAQFAGVLGGASGAAVTDISLAYTRCEAITRREARNFFYGIRLLPGPKRAAMSALYAFARRVDDIGDGAGTTCDKQEALARTRAEIAEMASGNPPREDPVLVALADAMSRYPIPVGALGEIVAGCEMDCRQGSYATFEELIAYCRCVAGSVGRLSLGVFGSADTVVASELADELGIALQLTNILRDVVEDREQRGRIYLPGEDLARFGCRDDATGPADALVALLRFEASRARRLYQGGLELLELLDRRSRACVAAMAGIYHRILGRIESDPLASLDHRVSLPVWEKALVAARGLTGASVT